MPSTADVVWVDVLPSMKGFISNLRNGTVKDAKSVGDESGKAYSDSFRAQAAAGVEKSAAQLSAAHKQAEAAADKHAAASRRLADAMGAQHVANARLNQLMQAGTATTTQLASASEALNKATRRVEEAEVRVARTHTTRF